MFAGLFEGVEVAVKKNSVAKICESRIPGLCKTYMNSIKHLEISVYERKEIINRRSSSYYCKIRKGKK